MSRAPGFGYAIAGLISSLRLQERASLHIHDDELLPSVLSGVVHAVLPIHSADIRAFGVNGAVLAGHVVMPASAIATIEKAGFGGQMNVLAAQAALGAGEGRRSLVWAGHKNIVVPAGFGVGQRRVA